MLMPDKHIRLSESLIGFGAYILGKLDRPKTVDKLWAEFESERDSERFPAHQSFDNLILTLGFLYAIGAVEMNRDGSLKICD